MQSLLPLAASSRFLAVLIGRGVTVSVVIPVCALGLALLVRCADFGTLLRAQMGRFSSHVLPLKRVSLKT